MKCKVCNSEMEFSFIEYDPKYDSILAKFTCYKCPRKEEQLYEPVEAKGLDSV